MRPDGAYAESDPKQRVLLLPDTALPPDALLLLDVLLLLLLFPDARYARAEKVARVERAEKPRLGCTVAEAGRLGRSCFVAIEESCRSSGMPAPARASTVYSNLGEGVELNGLHPSARVGGVMAAGSTGTCTDLLVPAGPRFSGISTAKEHCCRRAPGSRTPAGTDGDVSVDTFSSRRCQPPQTGWACSVVR